MVLWTVIANRNSDVSCNVCIVTSSTHRLYTFRRYLSKSLVLFKFV